MVASDDELLTLPAVARALGVHYMTAYRYIRTGRLPAVKVGSQWRITPTALARMRRDPAGAPTRRPTGRPDRIERLHERLVAGDEHGCWLIIEEALTSGATPAAVHLDLLGPALTHVGDRWAAGTLPVSGSRRASCTAARLVGRLGPRFARRGRNRAGVVLGSVLGDDHALPTALMADLLRERGLEAVDLGPDVAPFVFGEVCATPGVGAVGLCVTLAGNEDNVRHTTAQLRRAGLSQPIVVGGGAVTTRRAALSLGSTDWAPGAAATVELLDRLATEHVAGQR